MVEVLGRRVAAVQSGLVGNHTEPASHSVEVVGQTEAIQLDRARVGAQDAAEAPKRGRLPGSVLAQQHEELALLHLEVDAVDRDDISKALAESVDPDHWLDGRDETVSFRSFE